MKITLSEKELVAIVKKSLMESVKVADGIDFDIKFKVKRKPTEFLAEVEFVKGEEK